MTRAEKEAMLVDIYRNLVKTWSNPRIDHSLKLMGIDPSLPIEDFRNQHENEEGPCSKPPF